MCVSRCSTVKGQRWAVSEPTTDSTAMLADIRVLPRDRLASKTLRCGLQVFFRGASVNAVRGFPMSATMFLTYELSLQFFRSL